MKKKILMIVGAALCAVLLVAGSVVGTLAYLTSHATVTNVFTVGNVGITLDEERVKTDGTQYPEDQRERTTTGNEYHLIPGVTYKKDPRVTIKANSEANYLFVKVVNGFASAENLAANVAIPTDDTVDATETIAEQMAYHGWVLMDATNNIYYFDANAATLESDVTGNKSPNANIPMVMVDGAATKAIAKNEGSIFIQIFDNFTVSNKANLDLLKDLDNNGQIDTKIEVTAYSVQATGFATPEAAWAETFGAGQ